MSAQTDKPQDKAKLDKARTVHKAAVTTAVSKLDKATEAERSATLDAGRAVAEAILGLTAAGLGKVEATDEVAEWTGKGRSTVYEWLAAVEVHDTLKPETAAAFTDLVSLRKLGRLPVKATKATETRAATAARETVARKLVKALGGRVTSSDRKAVTEAVDKAKGGTKSSRGRNPVTTLTAEDRTALRTAWLDEVRTATLAEDPDALALVAFRYGRLTANKPEAVRDELFAMVKATREAAVAAVLLAETREAAAA